MARRMFVHGVVQHLGHTMMQRPFIGAADVHPGLLADGLQPFKFAES
jgi:hypothetical protein